MPRGGADNHLNGLASQLVKIGFLPKTRWYTFRELIDSRNKLLVFNRQLQLLEYVFILRSGPRSIAFVQKRADIITVSVNGDSDLTIGELMFKVINT